VTRFRILVSLIALLAALVRAPTIGRSLPYLGYVDEGHVLHRVETILEERTWDPGWYSYPSLTPYVIATAVVALGPVYRVINGRPLSGDLSGEAAYYDFVTPPEVILIGRAVVLLFSLGVVIVGMMLAWRIGGRRAGMTAGILLSLCPALVQRSSVVIVDTVASFFVIAAVAVSQLLLETLEMKGSGKTAFGLSVAAGVLAGFAAASKYPAGMVFVATATIIVLSGAPKRARLLLGASLGAGVAAIVAMPAFVLRAQAVIEAMREQSRLYSDPSLFTTDGAGPSLLRQAFRSYEAGLFLPIFAVAAWILLALRRETRVGAVSLGAFAIVLLIPIAVHQFQPFRNALPLVPPFIVVVAVALSRWSKSLSGRGPIFLAGCVGAIVLSWMPGFKMIAEIRGARDTRVEVVDWMIKSRIPSARVLVEESLAILPAELERLGGAARVAIWRDIRRNAESGQFDFLVCGRFDLAGSIPRPTPVDLAEATAYENWLSTLPLVERVGSVPTPFRPGWWRSNSELLMIVRLQPIAPSATSANESVLRVRKALAR
jgi:4-amino-4-deoxy-L-arabinose transferase-like glycosyltransferase